MKKTALMTVLAGMIAAPCLMAAGIQVGYSGSGYGQWQTDRGGEFTVTPLTPFPGVTLDYDSVKTANIGQPGSFQTFCIEENEYIYPYGYTAQGTLSDRAVYGGVGGKQKDSSGNTYDPLSVGTAWLYKQFATGVLADYDYSPSGRNNSARLLQYAIWWLEDEITTQPAPNTFVDAVLAKFGAAAKTDNNGQYGVKVLNLSNSFDGGRTWSPGQDQLVSVPDGGLSISFLGMGMVVLGYFSRRFKA